MVSRVKIKTDVTIRDKINYLIMFKVKGTNIEFENRKQAINILGQSRYRRLLKENKFEFANKDNGKENN